MIINEAKLKEYIRKVLMETFYAHPDHPGQLITKDQLLKIDPDFFTRQQSYYDPNVGFVKGTAPENVEGVSKGYPHRLANEAKKEIDSVDPATLELIKQKIGTITFGEKFGSDFLDMLAFNVSDLDLHAPEVSAHKENEKESYTQGILLMGSFLPTVADYIEALADYTGFKSDPTKEMRLSPDKKGIFTDDVSLISDFFFIPDQGKIGMGSSLIDIVSSKMLASLMTINNMTPQEFADTHYAKFERTVNAAFKMLFENHQNIDVFTKIKKAYLDSIYYVLREFIAEANFESAYMKFGNASGSPQPASSDYRELMFLPSDPQYLKILDSAAKQLQYDTNSNVDIAELIRDIQGFASYHNISELRSLPSYYDMKFSYNPNYGSNAAADAEGTFDFRMNMNLSFGVGFQKEGIPVYYSSTDADVGKRWEKS